MTKFVIKITLKMTDTHRKMYKTMIKMIIENVQNRYKKVTKIAMKNDGIFKRAN